MTIDNLLLWIHILAAAVWLGGGVMLTLLARQATQTGETRRIVDQMEWVGPRIGAPVSLLIPITGVWMVLRNESWEFSDFWILGSLVLFAVVFAVGVGFHGPNYKRIHLAEKQGDASAASTLINRSFSAARWEVAILVIVVGLMVFKP